MNSSWVLPVNIHLVHCSQQHVRPLDIFGHAFRFSLFTVYPLVRKEEREYKAKLVELEEARRHKEEDIQNEAIRNVISDTVGQVINPLDHQTKLSTRQQAKLNSVQCDVRVCPSSP